MEDLRIGVIGAGGRGKLARLAHKPGDGSRIVAICDIRDDALAERREAYGPDVATFTDYRQMLEQVGDLDGVFVSSPDFLHEEQAVAALETGAAVYLEKPMAITVAGCDRILQTAERRGNRLFVGHNMRYMNIIRKMKQLIDADEIGEVKAIWCRHFVSYGGDAYFRDWHADRTKSTGLLLQKGAHDFDVMHHFAGAYTRRVSAFGALSVYDKQPRHGADEVGSPKWDRTHWPPVTQSGFAPVMDVEDHSTVNMELSNGVLGAYLQCHFTPDACRNYTVIGTKGRLENLGDGPESPICVWNRRTHTFNLIGDKVFRGDTIADTTGHGGADGFIVEDFLRFVRTGETTGIPLAAARACVVTGCMATRSLREGGKPYDIPPYPGPG